MKKLLKYLGVILVGLLLVVIAFAIFIQARGIPSYGTTDLKYTATVTPQAVERGQKLASMLCASCHLDHNTGKFTGQQMLDAPLEFGTIYSQNITQDPVHGIGEWTDAELLYLLRTGIKRNGQYAPPYMAKLPIMADEDINAIIAYLRSDDSWVTADPTPDKPCEPSFLTKFLCMVAFKPLPMPTAPVAMPDTNNTVELGRYLALSLDCFSCHSADFKTVDFLDPEKSVGYFGGGNKTLDRDRNVVQTMNLTPHQTGIGDWSKARFVKALRSGQMEGDEALRYPMLPYSQLTEHEAGAIFDYLRTIPPIDNKVKRSGL